MCPLLGLRTHVHEIGNMVNVYDFHVATPTGHRDVFRVECSVCGVVDSRVERLWTSKSCILGVRHHKVQSRTVRVTTKVRLVTTYVCLGIGI